jgi:hypothetical protein
MYADFAEHAGITSVEAAQRTGRTVAEIERRAKRAGLLLGVELLPDGRTTYLIHPELLRLLQGGRNDKR